MIFCTFSKKFKRVPPISMHLRGAIKVCVKNIALDQNCLRAMKS
jgi:hypothetical protein